MYNGKYDQHLLVTVKANNHDTCLSLAKTIKKQCDAWWFSVSCTEDKSARTGPVLERSFRIRQIAYGHDIIAFREALRCVCNHFKIQKFDVSFEDKGTLPENARKELTK